MDEYHKLLDNYREAFFRLAFRRVSKRKTDIFATPIPVTEYREMEGRFLEVWAHHHADGRIYMAVTLVEGHTPEQPISGAQRTLLQAALPTLVASYPDAFQPLDLYGLTCGLDEEAQYAAGEKAGERRAGAEKPVDAVMH